MNIIWLAAELCKRIKIQPHYLLFLFLDTLVTIFYFPKFLYFFFKREKIVSFAWGNGLYGSFYMPIFEKLDECGIKTVFFFDFGNPKQYGMTVFRKGLPRFYGDFLDNKIVISASGSKYKKLNRTTRVQIFHGPGSFGGGWQKEYVKNFDILFLVTRFQWEQLQGEKKEIAEGKKIFKIGFPKIDKYICSEIGKETSEYKKTTIFYGPTFHREISSIFEFLPAIVQTCQKNNYKLIIKLHPLLYHKHNPIQSGGVDWLKEIHRYQKNYRDIVLLKGNKDDLGKYFKMTEIFVTDVSALGFEFVLSTAKPIVFLGDKLKIPLEDLHSGNIDKYKDYPEVYYRGMVGPVVTEPQKFEETLKEIIENDTYKAGREKCRKEYVFNLGTASDAAVSQIKKIYEES